jgi:hypothetical protein
LLIDRFVAPGVVRSSDCFITTNWDILLDRARHQTFGSTSGDYGTDATLVPRIPLDEAQKGRRPKLFKLHGSLNWLQTQPVRDL